MKNRIISLLLLLCTLVSLASCDKGKDNNTPPVNNDFIVETVPVEYSAQQIADAGRRVAEIAEDLIEALGYADHVTEDDIEEIGKTFENDVVPMLIDVAIYPEELFELLDCIDDFSALLGDENSEQDIAQAISDLYAELASVLDAERVGEFVYEMQLFVLAVNAEQAQEKYDKYGYAFYLEDVKRYEALIDKARSIGRKDFADAISVLIFTASALNASLDIESDKGISISAADTADILKQQGERFAALSLDVEDWQTVAAIYEELLPTTSSQSLEGKVLLALNNDNFFMESADVMPDVLAFYGLITADISPESISLIENGEEYAYPIAACTELMKNEGAFRELLGKLAEKIPSPTTACIIAVNSSDKAGYAEFLESYSADIDGLILSVKAFLNAPGAESYVAMNDACIGYAASINSVLAYVYLYN